MKALYQLTGVVVTGKRLGTKLGFPTANIQPDDSASTPPAGVYIALCQREKTGERYFSIVNDGRHPTFPEGAPTVEAHLMDYAGGELYGERLSLTYLLFLREETKFPSGEALAKQLTADLARLGQYAQDNAALKTKGASMEENCPIILEDVCYAYDEGENNAVDHVSLTVPKGQFVAVLGHNGSGKSTLAKLMNALFLPSSGRALVCGMDTAKDEDIWKIRSHAGMVFQNPDNQIVATVVREDVAFGLENLGVEREEMIKRIDQALSDVRMTEFAASAPHMLSGGQKQRVAIAGVLAMAPDVMILDESTAMLDPSGRSEVLSTVRRLNKERGITVVWITHFMEEAALSDRIVVIDHGKVALDGVPHEVFANADQLQALGLDVPPMALLARDLTAAGLELPAGILTVDEMVKELNKALCPSS